MPFSILGVQLFANVVVVWATRQSYWGALAFGPCLSRLFSRLISVASCRPSWYLGRSGTGVYFRELSSSLYLSEPRCMSIFPRPRSVVTSSEREALTPFELRTFCDSCDARPMDAEMTWLFFCLSPHHEIRVLGSACSFDEVGLIEQINGRC